ncbi:MAG: hypothetical protein CMB28_06310 [Euryarchaeota archaeon]|nr:hypothetical protein [Euryarchaeota archaeon]|tara:strand:- start:1812 stop:2447 length:636 start_codon:yes stop_codon:yes gene_type:complete
MEEALESTTPFLTIDPMVSERLESVHSALLNGGWESLILNDVELKKRLESQGVERPEDRSSIKWDDANIFFLSCIALSPIGQPLPLEAGISKERFGRFPFGNGSPLTYLRDWIRDSKRDPESLESLSELLEKLDSRLSGTSMERGVGRLDMRGWLTLDETINLRKALTSKCWMPAANEPLDGGCQDAAKHLLAMLRAAEKRRCGILLRVHN